MGNFLLSLWKGDRAGDNPWEATTLEWSGEASNAEGLPPVVYRGPYEYSTPGAAKDYSMQTEDVGKRQFARLDPVGAPMRAGDFQRVL